MSDYSPFEAQLKQLGLLKKSFFFTIQGSTQSLSGPLDDVKRFVQLIPVSYKSNRPNNITSVDKFHLQCDCTNGSIVNGIREPFLLSFVLDTLPRHKTHKEPRIKLYKRINKSVLSHITFYSEDDDHKPVDFNNETKSFTCQLIKIYFYQMNQIMIRPKNETEILHSITKNCETLIKQTHTKLQGTLEFKLTKSRETFHSKPPISVEGSWMIGLTS